MTHSIVIGAPDQTIGYELRSLVEEMDDYTVVDVADSSKRVEVLVNQRDPEILLLHGDLGPTPILQLTRDIVSRRPGTAVILITEDLSARTFAAAMDAGARGAIGYPVSLEDLQTRLGAAANWVGHMRKHLKNDDTGEPGGPLRGRLVVVAGAKGGVGTSTVAAHIGHDAVTRVSGRSVCIVDLDLEKGDVGNLLGISHRLDVSDLAKVADDLGSQTVQSAIHRSPSGLSALLAPSRLEDVGSVGTRETILILSALRRQFDLVIVDAGSSVNPINSVAVETASQVVLVTTPDVLALRGVHRTIEAWNRFDVCKTDDVRILLNRVSKESDIQPDTAARLVPVTPLEVWLPEAYKTLERGLNYQTPGQVRSNEWWNRIHQLAAAIETVPVEAEPAKREFAGRSGRRNRKTSLTTESGQATVEFAALIPLVLILIVTLWQVGLWGVSAAYAGHAADEAARAASIGLSDAQVNEAALAAVPSWFRGGIEVQRDQTREEVAVRAALPILVPGVESGNLAFTSRVGIVSERS